MTTSPSIPRKFGSSSAYALSILTLVTFAVAMMAVPPVGPFCPGDCWEYPYLEALDNYPRDFIWMGFALVQLVAYLLFSSTLHQATIFDRRVFSLPALMLAGMACTILFLTYYVQMIVVPQSLYFGETEGVALLNMYNENGVFIAQEEIAYLLMSLSLFLFSWTLERSGRTFPVLRWLLRSPLILSLVALAYVGIAFGFERSYRFEVFTISANWLVLIASGFALVRYFKTPLSHE